MRGTSVRGQGSSLQPEAGGPADQVRAAYGASYDRLVTLKDKYDPTNFFRQNLNIPPTGSGLQSAIGR